MTSGYEHNKDKRERAKYGLCHVGRSWHLTKKIKKGVFETVLTGPVEADLLNILLAIQGTTDQSQRKWGRLQVGKRYWIVTPRIGMDTCRALGWSLSEKHVNDVLLFLTGKPLEG